MTFERHYEPLLPIAEFRRRVTRFALLALFITLVWWGIGILGYHFLANLSWIDAILNSAMIVGGMGPVDPLPNAVAKLFASVYAITSGAVFIGAVGLLFSPIIHRIYHHFHINEVGDEGDGDQSTV